MIIRLALLALSCIELVIWVPMLWRFRRSLAQFSSGLVVLTLIIFATDLSLWTYLVCFFGLYRLVNLRCLVKDRVQPDYLYGVTLKTSLTLIGLQALAAAVSLIHVGPETGLIVIAALQVAAAGGLWLTTRHNLRLSEGPKTLPPLTDRGLPTITVAIPARNETDDLRACLESLVASDYPKLEILVLDDCSQNKRTPEIIRGYAHDGVRFISGEVPPEHWLAKNFAYHQLAEAANGDILLFCGVDTRFRPATLRAIVDTMQQRKLSMLAWLPRNVLGERRLPAELIQPTRYAWELILPRKWLKRPPVLSTCWLISTTVFQDAGGFKAISRSASPESYFARTTATTGSYGFLRSTDLIGLESRKDPAEQRNTALRTRYLQVNRKPAVVALSSLAEIGLMTTPLLMLLGLVFGTWPAALLAALASGLLASIYASMVRLTYQRFLLSGLWQFPLAAGYDLYLLNLSMWRYEFAEVLWKGRNICLPVMRFIADSARKP